MIFCADDFGLDRSCNSAIIELCKKKKINAVSVLIEMISHEQANELKAFRHEVKIGLHLNLLRWPEVSAQYEIQRQFKMFTDKFGFFPEFADGHLHSQIYPYISDALIVFLKSQELTDDFFVRSVKIHPELLTHAGSLKSILYLRWLNFFGRRFAAKLKKNGIGSSGYCWGSYNRHASSDEIYRLAREYGDGNDIFFLHPGLSDFDKLERKSDFEFAMKENL
jgi:predicted glycoside hydrolase/deacetylase ChbG (UPF0249 family)